MSSSKAGHRWSGAVLVVRNQVDGPDESSRLWCPVEYADVWQEIAKRGRWLRQVNNNTEWLVCLAGENGSLVAIDGSPKPDSDGRHHYWYEVTSEMSEHTMWTIIEQLARLYFASQEENRPAQEQMWRSDDGKIVPHTQESIDLAQDFTDDDYQPENLN